MRIARLDLARYGHFTDLSLALPQGTLDFHLLVGPNEAGKSTLRRAILDLLFGIELRSPYNFRHAYPDLRLGARIEQADAALDFHRVKARTRTLRDAHDAVLPDTALAPFLGACERGFFEQMFGLDHARLVAGGRDILSAANDVGQILFQSAAGIARFGRVREALEQEADALWAKRRSGEREYYIAADALAQAQEALKQATVRTRDWVAARAEVERLEQEAAQTQARYEALAKQRARLERARRVAPVLHALREREAALAALGAVAPLAADAGRSLDAAERAMALAHQARQLYETQASALAADLARIRPNHALLARAQDIEALAAQRHQVRNHPADIAKRQEEARAHWKTLEGLARALGWPAETPEALAERLPSQVVRAAAAALVRRHDTLAQALDNAREAEALKQGELAELDQALAQVPASELPGALVSALDAAQALGDVTAQAGRLGARVERAEREFAAAEAALGQWPMDLATLRRLVLPGDAERTALREARDRGRSEADGLAQRRFEHQAAIADLDLGIAQYQAAHQPVAVAELTAARQARDRLWAEIRAGTRALPAAGATYEDLVRTADDLADRRHDKAQEAASLQSQRDQRARLIEQLAQVERRTEAQRRQQAAQAADWETRMAALGLPGMTLEQLGPWCAARERVLAAAEEVAAARADQAALCRQAEAARDALAAALVPASEPAAESAPEPSPESGESLAALVLSAAQRVETVRRAHARRSALSEQRAAAVAALQTLAGRRAQAQAALASWGEEWARCLVDLHLPAATATGAAEGALAILARIEEHLDKQRDLRDARINPMRRDLTAFADAANRLARDLGPDLDPEPTPHLNPTPKLAADLAARAPEEIAQVLAERLAQARADDREQQRLSAELQAVRARADAEAARLREAEATLAPLLHAAAATDTTALRAAIARSDQRRALQAEIDALARTLGEGSDGLARAELEAELAALDPGAIPAQLQTLEQDLDALIEQQRDNAAALRTAQTCLERIAGQDDAARAEAARQEALARMGRAVERYLRTYTAARLLRWAIERYREARQGPMLRRAGEVFAALTLGSFERLVVDYEKEPPTLHGQRPDGERVGIAGLSDGTRDQLYLALRLAALELHLDQSPPLPFIADDLFINWDAERASAGLEALVRLSARTQVIFLTHHDHLVAPLERIGAGQANIIRLVRAEGGARSPARPGLA